MKRGHCLWCGHPKSDHDGRARGTQRLRWGESIRWTTTACSKRIDMTGEPCMCRTYEPSGG